MKETHQDAFDERDRCEAEALLEETVDHEFDPDLVDPEEEEEAAETTVFETPLGGIMTQEVGTITGPVELWIEGNAARIRYEGALDVYTVAGKVNGRSLEELVEILTSDPGIGVDGNPNYTSLEDAVSAVDEEVAAGTAETSEMASYVCLLCGYIYDPVVGDPDNGVPAGTAFEDVPEDWLCPLCGAGKDQFEVQ